MALKELMEPHMKRPKDNPYRLPQHDYALALQSAVSWLGDRYLLAQPAPRTQEAKPFFVEPRRWHQVSRPLGPAGRKH
jgi:hypothetical protein